MSTAYIAPHNLTPFSEIVENVQNGSAEGLDQLYRVFQMISGSLRRQVGFRDFEDRMHDIFLLVVDAIREGKLRETGALISYIHGVARLSLCSAIGVRSRHQRLSGQFQQWVMARGGKQTPEDTLVQKEREQIMRQMIGQLSDRESEILTRFYIREQSKEQICLEMDLTETQFRLAKSRAKQRLSRAGVEHRTGARAEMMQAA